MACGDKEFQNYAKQKHTQHQIIFEAVQVDEFFPFGVKVSYRAYSQDDVFELVKTSDSGNSVSVQLCKVSTFPKETKVSRNETSSNKDVTIPAGISPHLPLLEPVLPLLIGMYLIERLPDLEREDIAFRRFSPGGRAEFDTCLQSVKTFYGAESDVAKEWVAWQDDVIPDDDDVEAYIKK